MTDLIIARVAERVSNATRRRRDFCESVGLELREGWLYEAKGLISLQQHAHTGKFGGDLCFKSASAIQFRLL